MAFKFSLRFSSIVIVFLSLFLAGMAKSPPLVGGPAPSFELETISGKIIKLSDLKGKFVILNFWATWCVPCAKEMPEFQKAHQSLDPDNVGIMAINLGERKKKVNKFIQDYRLSLPVLLDKFGNVSEKYKVTGLPVTYFINTDGIIRDKIFGGGITKEMIEIKLNQFKGVSK
tara:strand:+ start:589 stop:1104 length:516 start_codon:yes stop_codon:yes gene_type:complete